MGIPGKSKEHMVRVIQQAVDNHKLLFGTSLTKKEMEGAVRAALHKKKEDWVKAQVADHSIAELLTLLDAISEHRNEKVEKSKQESKKTLLGKLRGK